MLFAFAHCDVSALLTVFGGAARRNVEITARPLQVSSAMACGLGCSRQEAVSIVCSDVQHVPVVQAASSEAKERTQC